MSGHAGVDCDVTSPRRFQFIVATIANVSESRLANSDRQREKGNQIGIYLDVGGFDQAVVEMVIDGADGLSIKALAEHLSSLDRTFQALRRERGHIQGVVKEDGEGQVQAGIVKPARRLIADQSSLLQAAHSGLKRNGVGAAQEIETKDVQRRERADSRGPEGLAVWLFWNQARLFIVATHRLPGLKLKTKSVVESITLGFLHLHQHILTGAGTFRILHRRIHLAENPQIV